MGTLRDGWILLGSILACLVAGILPGLATAGDVTGWYATLRKPAWNPPNWLFGPVWTLLYVLMGIALWRILLHRDEGIRTLLLLFALQLVLNMGWSIIFFRWHRIGFALAEIVLLLAVIALLVVLAWPVDRWAAILLLPYVLWVSFATVLNASIWSLNR